MMARMQLPFGIGFIARVSFWGQAPAVPLNFTRLVVPSEPSKTIIVLVFTWIVVLLLNETAQGPDERSATAPAEEEGGVKPAAIVPAALLHVSAGLEAPS